MKEYGKRFGLVTVGTVVCTFGCVLMVKAEMGLAPWDAFFMGLSICSGMLYGTIVTIGSLCILALAVWMREKIGWGSLLCAWLSGIATNLFMLMELSPTGIVEKTAVLLAGCFFLSLGTYIQMLGALGCGARDALLVGLGRRFSRVPLGLVRGVLEGSVLLIGWLLGAKVGIGTILCVAGTSVTMEMVFRLFHFDATKIRHEDFLETARRLRMRGRAAH